MHGQDWSRYINLLNCPPVSARRLLDVTEVTEMRHVGSETCNCETPQNVNLVLIPHSLVLEQMMEGRGTGIAWLHESTCFTLSPAPATPANGAAVWRRISTSVYSV